jgi:chromosome segregation ATPase
LPDLDRRVSPGRLSRIGVDAKLCFPTRRTISQMHSDSDAATLHEIADLERRLEDFRAARARVGAEREQYERQAAQAAAVLHEIAPRHRDLHFQADERRTARDRAVQAREAAELQLARIAEAKKRTAAERVAAEQRLAEIRTIDERVAQEYANAQIEAASVRTAEAAAVEAHEEARRAAAELQLKIESANADRTLAEENMAQLRASEEAIARDFAETESRLQHLRTARECAQVEADLARLREMELRVASERAELERRLNDVRAKLQSSTQMRNISETQIKAAASAAFNALFPKKKLDEPAPPPTDAIPAVSIGSRLARDFSPELFNGERNGD